MFDAHALKQREYLEAKERDEAIRRLRLDAERKDIEANEKDKK